MDFLLEIKRNYEENEHLHLLLKNRPTIVTIELNSKLHQLNFFENKCLFLEDLQENNSIFLQLHEDQLLLLKAGKMLSDLINNQQVIFRGSLRQQLLVETLIFLTISETIKEGVVV